jgi:FeS assembly SUF system protein
MRDAGLAHHAGGVEGREKGFDGMSDLAQAQDMDADTARIGADVVDRLKSVFDPEIPANIYDLGLIYKIDITPAEEGKFVVAIDMTLTTPNCPVAEQMPAMVMQAVDVLDEVKGTKVNLVWTPSWDKSRMTDEARMMLNMF